MPKAILQQIYYLVVGRECMAPAKVEVWGWKAGIASSVYIPPLCRWFKLTISVITTSPVSCKYIRRHKTYTHHSESLPCALSLSMCSHCESKACILGDVPMPGEHRGAPAPLWRQPRPPEMPVIFGNPEGVWHIEVCQLFKHLRGGNANTADGYLYPVDEYVMF